MTRLSSAILNNIPFNLIHYQAGTPLITHPDTTAQCLNNCRSVSTSRTMSSARPESVCHLTQPSSTDLLILSFLPSIEKISCKKQTKALHQTIRRQVHHHHHNCHQRSTLAYETHTPSNLPQNVSVACP